MLHNIWDEIIHPFPKFNACPTEVWEWMGKIQCPVTCEMKLLIHPHVPMVQKLGLWMDKLFHPTLYNAVITYPCWV